jgi:hypothetical protein
MTTCRASQLRAANLLSREVAAADEVGPSTDREEGRLQDEEERGYKYPDAHSLSLPLVHLLPTVVAVHRG